MAFVPDPLTTLEKRQLARYRNKFTDKALGTEDFLGKLAKAEAAGHFQQQQRMRRVSLDMVPQDGSLYAALSTWATAIGLSDGDSGYGPLKPTLATGIAATATGTPAAVVWDGIGDAPTLTGPDGVTQFELTALATVGGGGTVTVAIDAVTKGTGGNVSVGDILRFDAPPANVGSTVTVTTGATNAIDAEETQPLLARILDRWRNPPKGGTAPDYRTWCELAAGIIEVYVYPLRYGTGSVDMVILKAGQSAYSTSTRDPGATLKTLVQAIVDASRTLTAKARVLRPTLGTGLTIAVRVTPSADKYDFDWNSATGGPWTVDTIVNSTHIKLDILAPTDLKAAIDAGDKPRVQIRTTGAVLPVEHRCTGWSDGGGKTTLTIETALTASTTPTVGDSVYAGGPVVADVAQAIKDYVDALGPSKSSGYADSGSTWDDVARIDQIRRAALDAADTDGTRFVVAFVATPTINGGTADVTPTDNSIDPPALNFAKWISVLP